MNRILLLTVFSFVCLSMFGQQQKTIVIEKESQISVTSDNDSDSEKEISVGVNVNENGEREVSITITEDGNTDKIEWQDNGEIPADIQKMLDEKGIDVQMLTGGEKKTMMFIGEDDDIVVKKKRVMIMESDEGGEEMEIEWDGEGEMPAEMQKIMEEHDIDLSELKGGRDGKKKVKMKMMRMEGDDMDGPHRMRKHKKGERRKRVMIMDTDGRSEEMEIEWDGEGEMPAEMQKIMEEHDIDLSELREGDEGKKVKMKVLKIEEDDMGALHGPHRRMKFKKGGGDMSWIEKGEGKMKRKQKKSKTHMGVQITYDGGAVIVDGVMEDSPADKAGLKKGDVIKEINGGNIRDVDDLLTILTFFDVDDTIKIDYERGGKSKSAKVKLAAKPKAYR